MAKSNRKVSRSDDKQVSISTDEIETLSRHTNALHELVNLLASQADDGAFAISELALSDLMEPHVLRLLQIAGKLSDEEDALFAKKGDAQ
jgi:hypothetical protein